MNNRTTRNSNNNSNWNNINQNNKSNSNNTAINDSDIQTIHKLNPHSNNHNVNQQPAQNLKSNQTEFSNEIEMDDYVAENFINEAENQRESFKEYKLSAEEIDSIIKRGQTKITLNNLANKMMEDLRILSSEIFETIENLSVKFNDNTTTLLKNASDYKKKIDGLVGDPTERNKNIEILKYLRDKISNNQI